MNITEPISIYKGTKPEPECEVPLSSFINAVKDGDYSDQITAIRETSDPKVKQELKKQLLSATISGTFSYRKVENLKKHSGFISIDLDGKENPSITDWPAARDNIGSIKEVVFCALSASGKGCFAIIPLAYPEQHKSQFEALKRDFLTLGYVIDQSCSDVSRLRFLSSDVNAVYNGSAIPYRRIYTPKPPVIHMPKTGFNNNSEDKIFNDARNYLSNKGEMFINGSRNKYLRDLAGYLHRFGVSESYTRSKCMEYQQDDFTAKEIEAIVKWAFSNISWSNIANNR
jgi:hypothetical protein